MTGVAYSPYGLPETIARGELLALARTFRGRRSGDPTVASLSLLLRDPDGAVEILRGAAGPSRDARAMSDLAAAYLEAAAVDDRPEMLLDGLVYADRALAIDPRLAEAAFNRALALQFLGLHVEAASAWRSYFRLDDRSPWAGEARRNLRALQWPSVEASWAVQRRALFRAALRGESRKVEGIVSSFPQFAREEAEDVLLASWAREWRLGREPAALRWLRMAGWIGAALERSSGEAMLADTVRAIAAARGDPDAMARMAEGHVLYRQGLTASDAADFRTALASFTAAERLLRESGSPFHRWARFRAAVASMQLGRYEQALRLLDEAHLPAGYGALRGRTFWVTGLIRGIGGHPAEALALYNAAAGCFSRAGEVENLASVYNLIAEQLREIGSTQAAWRQHHLAALMLPGVRSVVRRQALYEELGATVAQLGRPEVVSYFQGEAAKAGARAPSLPVLIHGLQRMALIDQQVGRYERAEAFLLRATRLLGGLPDPGVRAAMAGQLSAARGALLALTDPARAVALLTTAIDRYRATGYHQLLLRLYAERARAFERQGQFDRAEADLERAAAGFVAEREPMGLRQRDDLAAVTRDVFDRLVVQKLRRGQAAAAFERAEWARMEPRSEAIPGDRTGGPSAAEIGRELPPRTALVAYYLTDSEILAWVVTADGLHAHRGPRPAGLQSEIEALRRSIESGGFGQESAARLHRWLIEPLLPWVPAGHTLVLVPDGPLQAIPFAALGETSFLIERNPLIVAPSARIFIGCRRRMSRLDAGPVDVLSIGDPRFARDLAPALAPLPGAEAEARQVAAGFREARLVLGAAATRRALVENLGRYAFIHFAGHSLVNNERPELSAFLLAPEAGVDSGVLYARDLPHLRTGRTRLVVLSSCNTFAGERSGIANLSYPWLAAGVPAVLGTLWPLEDQAARKFAASFYGRLRRGYDTASALRRAQLDFLAGADRDLRAPARWAGYELIGASDSPGGAAQGAP